MSAVSMERRKGFDEITLGFTEEDAKREADRCLRCECKVCVKECEFLKTYCEAPKQLAERLRDGALKETPEVVFSCNLCSLCEQVCPQDLNVGKMCLDLRRQLVEEGLAPLQKHQPIVAGQQWALESFALTLPDATAETKRFFFPGCNLSAYSPDLVMNTYEYVRNKLPGTGIILNCCGGPTHALGDQARLLDINGKTISEMKKFGASELILACPHCYHIFHDYAPEIHVTSVYEIIAQHGLPEGARCPTDKPFSLHDSCNTRHEGKVQDAVRQILRELGCKVEEPKFSREMTRCCGMGGMIAYVDFKLANKVTMRRAKELPHDALSYCASCRDSFATVGKPSLHLLDLLFNAEWEKAKKSPPKQGPAKQQAQLQLRESLIKERGES